MTNKETSKELLSAIQKIVSETKGQCLNEELIAELELITKPITEFYEITSFQALVFSVYLECGLRDIDVDTEKIQIQSFYPPRGNYSHWYSGMLSYSSSYVSKPIS